MSIPEDPYFAGRIARKAGPSEGPSDLDGYLVRDWAYVFLANLVVPFPLGMVSIGDFAAELGILVALVSLFWSGWRVISASRPVGRALVVGGWIVGLCQFFPVLQIAAGSIGLGAARALGYATKHGPMVSVTGVMGGFVATTVTGVCLISLAMALGLPVAWAKSWSDRKKNGKIM